jgi:hypothetical protein
MKLDKLPALLADMLRVNERYLRDGHYRNDVRERLAGTTSRVVLGIARAERRRAPALARPYEGLTDTSLALAGISTTRRSPGVVLVVDEIREGAAFAGVHTALAVAAGIAERLQTTLTVVMVRWTAPGNSAAQAEKLISGRFEGIKATVVPREQILNHMFGEHDVWIATHWKTAHPLDVAATAGVVDRSRVVYLVQDYEPGFSPWSTEYAVAASTYGAGFRLLVNSKPLQRYLMEVEGLDVPNELTFSPHLDVALLERVAAAREHEPLVRVLFYGRPSKHRNLYRLGVSALRVAVQELGEDSQTEFHSAGEKHPDEELGLGHKLVSHGTMQWDEYFRFLASTNVVLSLQHSPHPSHPPFDGAISGARVVTNEFHGTRQGIHPHITPTHASPRALGQAIAEAVRTSSVAGPHPFSPLRTGGLGVPLHEALDALVMQLEMTSA